LTHVSQGSGGILVKNFKDISQVISLNHCTQDKHFQNRNSSASVTHTGIFL